MNRLLASACAMLIAVGGLTPMPQTAQAQSRAVATGATTQMVNLPRGASMAVDLPTDARDTIISNPQVAEALQHSARRVTIIGLQPGESDAVFLDAAGRTILSLRIRVDAGVGALQDTLARVLPGSEVRAEAVNDSIILSGRVASPGEAERAAQIARAFVSGPEKVINMTSLAGSDQVTLKVRVVEVQRSAIKQLGFSSDVVFNSGLQSFGIGRANTFGVNGSLLGGGGACFDQNRARTTNNSSTNSTTNQTNSGSTSNTIITNTSTNGSNTSFTTSDGRTITFDGGAPGSIQVTDFSGNTVTLTGRTAAEYLQTTLSSSSINSSILGTLVSTLTNTSGSVLTNTISNVVSSAFETVTGNNANSCLQAFERVGLARTLAEPNLTSVNGEDASFLAGGEVPIPSGRDRDGQVQITYKPYGVRLAFRPIVVSEGRISMQISVEVSELSNQGAFTIGAGTTTPLTLTAFNTRRVENTVELPSGGSMMIAGLLQEQTRQTIDSLPGLMGMPVLGSLFRSRDYLNGETELVVIVEPYIVSPTSPGRMQTPADGLRIANDAETILFGQLNQAYGSPAARPGGGWQGPVGYVIE